MATSQNGWPARPDLKLRPLTVAGVSFLPGIVDNDDVATVLGYVAEQFHKRVEPLKNPGCWGFFYRANRNDPTSLSNHSSGTAIDVNAPAHPNSVATAKTFTPAQIAEVHKILAEVGGVVRWGGDYTKTVDAMHFEINASAVDVAKVAARLRAPKPTGTRLAPGVRVYHNDTPAKYAGGTIGDSAAGTRDAKRKGYKRADCNGHLMHRTGVGRTLGKADTDVVWVNAHGAPFLPSWMKTGQRFEDFAWLTTRVLHPRLRSARATFRQNARAGIDVTEWEVKDVHPFVSDAALTTAFGRLANAAKSGYGPDWQRHVVVKVLTNLSGGLDYALKICRFAHAAGFDTMILPRGEHVHQVINEPFVKWNRGGRV